MISAEAIDRAIYLQNVMRMIDPNLNIHLYNGGYKIGLIERKDDTVAYRGRQESQGTVQGTVRMLVQNGLVDESINEKVTEITDQAVVLDGTVYSPSFDVIYEAAKPFANNSDTFARDFKGVVADVLLNGAAGGSTFMKDAKKQG